ncbi:MULTISPECIES: hypothetical protein [unclassified Streptomyces]|uniref:hypothetical protein n=1 Tax=unclassified Streptomyces TaxID=2593676 RepID=UPI000AE759CB|nr:MULTISPECIES: hypothetical protein [unclassified Streptomyces]
MSLLVVTMPIQSQGSIARDNVNVDVSAVAYFRVVDAGASTAQSPEPGGDRCRPEHHRRLPCPLMSTIGELGSFLARETAAAAPTAAAPPAGNGRTDKPLSPAGSAPGTAA